MCLAARAKVTQVRRSEIPQQVFVGTLPTEKAALRLTHTRRHVPHSAPLPPPLRLQSAPPDVLLDDALQVGQTKERPAPAGKKSH